MGLITVSASHHAFLGVVPEDLIDFGWQPSQSADGWRRSMHDAPERDFFLIAERDAASPPSEAIGLAWAGSSHRDIRTEGELKGLYVLPTQHGLGVGRRLVAATAARLEQSGATSMVVGCIRENTSCGFYRHLGGVETFRRPSAVDRFETEEIFFHWPDLATARERHFEPAA
ncbi:MAG: GNAT family N-acetyltransferase [Actinomycetota bacterium]